MSTVEECGRRGSSDSGPTNWSSRYLEAEGHREPGPVSDNFHAAGDDDPSPAGAGHDEFAVAVRCLTVDRVTSLEVLLLVGDSSWHLAGRGRL